MVTIRDAVDTDFPQIKQLTCASYVASGHIEPDSPYTQTLADITGRAEGLIVAEVDNHIAGAVNIAPPGSPLAQVATEEELEFRMLAVHPDFQGQGIGKALVQHVLHTATTLGASAVAITTMPSMTAAQAMYDSMGFQRAPQRDWNLYTAGIVDHQEDLETFLVYVHPIHSPNRQKEIHG